MKHSSQLKWNGVSFYQDFVENQKNFSKEKRMHIWMRQIFQVVNITKSETLVSYLVALRVAHAKCSL